MKKRAYSGSPWERQAAYCRAIRTGQFIAVSGTTAVDENGDVVGGESVYRQTAFVFAKIDLALSELGAGLKDVVRTRTFITDMGQFRGFARAHKEAFEGTDPAATCVEVSRLVDKRLLIEVEVDAVVP